MFILLNRVVYGLLEVLRSDRIFGLGFVLRLFPAPLPKTPDFCPPPSSPRKRGSRGGRTGKQRKNPRETQSTGSSRIWIPAFAGMTKERACLGLNAQNSSELPPTDFFKEPNACKPFVNFYIAIRNIVVVGAYFEGSCMSCGRPFRSGPNPEGAESPSQPRRDPAARTATAPIGRLAIPGGRFLQNVETVKP